MSIKCLAMPYCLSDVYFTQLSLPVTFSQGAMAKQQLIRGTDRLSHKPHIDHNHSKTTILYGIVMIGGNGGFYFVICY